MGFCFAALIAGMIPEKTPTNTETTNATTMIPIDI